MGLLSLGLGLAGTAFDLFSKRKAEGTKEQAFEATEQAIQQREAARRTQARLEQLKLARQRRGVAREARAARGQALQAGATSGAALDTSAIAGGIGGAESVEAASQAFLSQSAAGAQEISDFLGKASEFETEAARLTSKAAGQEERGSGIGSIFKSVGKVTSIFGF